MEASIATATRLRRDCHVGGDNVASARRSSRQISSLGSTISSEELRVAVEIGQSAGVRLVSDETYGLMTEGEPLPPAACADPTAVSLSTMSKTFGLPGIRIGWITTRDADLMHRLLAAREHITITNNVLGEYIALQVQRDPELFLARARARVAENRAIVADVIENNPRLDWIPPTTGVVQDHPTANIGLGTRVSFHVVDLGGEAAAGMLEQARSGREPLQGPLVRTSKSAWMEQGLREAAQLGMRSSLAGRSATLPEATEFHIFPGSPSARRSAARLLAEVRVSGWSAPSTRRRRARVSWSRVRDC
jgi:hypothetical protein